MVLRIQIYQSIGIISMKNRINANTVIEPSASYNLIKHISGKPPSGFPNSKSTTNKIYSFVIVENRKMHTMEKPYKCTFVDENNVECKESFFETKTFKAHMRDHTNSQPFTCEYCSKKFHHSGTFKAHLRYEHEQRYFFSVYKSKLHKMLPFFLRL